MGALIPFSLRFYIQWLQSEKEKKSVTKPIFWKLSLLGNTLMMLHYLYQAQFPFFALQICNAAIAKRQLTLNKEAQEKKITSLLFAFALFFILFTTLFFLRASLIQDFTIEKLFLPNVRFKTKEIHLAWHIVGGIGASLFTFRFWIQWLQSEKKQKSFLGKPFWYMSLVGSLITSTYAYYIGDLITLLGYITGMIPYLRNIMLMRKRAV